MADLSDYESRYSCARLRRENGILEVALHTNGASLLWGEVPHRELPELFADIGSDYDNRVIILTGTGDAFCPEMDRSSWATFNVGTTAGWDKIYFEGKRLLQNLLDIEVPMIAAINGPARIHAELAVLCDIVLASDTAVLQDAAHFSVVPPADGVHVIWPLLIGLNRARYFLIMAEEIDARAAKDLGIVNEVCSSDGLLPRAWEIARELSKVAPLTLRYTRVALTQMLKERMLAEVGHGLILEGAAVAASSFPT